MSSAGAVRVGVVGTGFGEKVVARAFNETEGCSVVEVVSSRDEAALRTLCARTDVDLLSVHSPPFLHLDHVRRVIESGRPVLCDKPFGRDAIEARSMLDLALQAERPHLLNFEMRCDPARKRLRSLLLGGAIGRPEHVVVSVHLALSRAPLRPYGWLFDRELGGGWIGAWGSHMIDFLRWTFGEFEYATAELRTNVGERPDGEGRPRRCTAEDGFTATLRTAGGVGVCIDSSFASAASLPGRMTFFGSEGVIEVVGERETVLHRLDGASETLESLDGAADVGTSMRAMAAVARDTVISGEAPPDAPTFHDGLACRVVMDRLRAGVPA